jgi:hypothetical protein
MRRAVAKWLRRGRCARCEESWRRAGRPVPAPSHALSHQHSACPAAVAAAQRGPHCPPRAAAGCRRRHRARRATSATDPPAASAAAAAAAARAAGSRAAARRASGGRGQGRRRGPSSFLPPLPSAGKLPSPPPLPTSGHWHWPQSRAGARLSHLSSSAGSWRPRRPSPAVT